MAKKEANRNTAKYDIERQYIVFINSEFTRLGWNESDVSKFRQLWEEELRLLDIAKLLNCSLAEALLLLADQLDQELIELRPTILNI